MLACKSVHGCVSISYPKEHDSSPCVFVVVGGEEIQSARIRVRGSVCMRDLSGGHADIACHCPHFDRILCQTLQRYSLVGPIGKGDSYTGNLQQAHHDKLLTFLLMNGDRNYPREPVSNGTSTIDKVPQMRWHQVR